MSDGGKGSAPRPFSVDRKTFEDNWDRIFGKSDFQDILSTEDCVIAALDKIESEIKEQIYAPLVKWYNS